MKTLAHILRDNWQWRQQIASLAMFDLRKKARGAVLGWAWFFIKPAMYIFCFWFALNLGLDVGKGIGYTDGPYILFLSAGVIPWFFMQDMFGSGADTLHRFSYLVNKIKFPISCISPIFTTSSMIVELMLMVCLFVMYFLCGMPLDIYLLQVPIILVLMYVFWTVFSITVSMLSGVTKDVRNFFHALSTPIFWLSGVLFNVLKIDVDWVQALLCVNPVTFFVSAFRNAFYNKQWFWENVPMLLGFLAVFAAFVAIMVIVYKKLNKEIADVL